MPSFSAAGFQPVLAADQASTVQIQWQLGHAAHIHGACTVHAQRLSSDDCQGTTALDSIVLCSAFGIRATVSRQP